MAYLDDNKSIYIYTNVRMHAAVKLILIDPDPLEQKSNEKKTHKILSVLRSGQPAVISFSVLKKQFKKDFFFVFFLNFFLSFF